MGGWHIAATVCGLVSLLLLLTALSSNHWQAHDNANYGLWKACVGFPQGVICYGFGLHTSSYVHATRAFLIVGGLAGVISCGLLFALFFHSANVSYSIIKAALISSHVAGVLALIAMAMFTASEGITSYYSWSFGLGWACIPLFHLTGGLAYRISTYTQF